jgi:murein DD-endopeptidase MepM/ murein hydrolase activator NlpD
MIPSDQLIKSLRRRLTVMLIPHSDGRPIHLNFSFAFLLFLLVGWTGLTVWSGFIVSRHVDYWKTKANESVLRARMWYFTQEMNRSREYLDRVKETEIALENLLKMKTRKAIVESDRAMGGPTSADRKDLLDMVTGRRPALDIDRMHSQLQTVRQSGSDVISNFEEISQYIDEQRQVFRATPVAWPAVGRVTSAFGQRNDPFSREEGEFHQGIDIANMLGTPIRATADGVVRVASWHGGYGRLIIIDHGRGYRTHYAHNAKILVSVGDRVKRGQIIGYMGTSGHSTGYHVHYEVWHNGRIMNPAKFAKAREE